MADAAPTGHARSQPRHTSRPPSPPHLSTLYRGFVPQAGCVAIKRDPSGACLFWWHHFLCLLTGPCTPNHEGPDYVIGVPRQQFSSVQVVGLRGEASERGQRSKGVGMGITPSPGPGGPSPPTCCPTDIETLVQCGGSVPEACAAYHAAFLHSGHVSHKACPLPLLHAAPSHVARLMGAAHRLLCGRTGPAPAVGTNQWAA